MPKLSLKSLKDKEVQLEITEEKHLNDVEKTNSILSGYDKLITKEQISKASMGQHPKIKEYATNLFCISCTYFQQIKGNYGRCGVIQKNTKFDGSKKGSACRAWRINPEININVDLQPRPQRATPYKTSFPIKRVHHPVAYEFAELIEPVKKEKRLKQLMEITPLTLSKLENLNYNSLSEKTGVLHYYSGSKTPAYIIDYILSMIDKKISKEEIIAKVYQAYQYKIGIGLVNLLYLKFHKRLFEQVPDLMRKEVTEKCPKCKGNLVKNGIVYNTSGNALQKLRCISCDYRFRNNSPGHYANHKYNAEVINEALSVLDDSMSLSEIADAIKQIFNIRVTRHTILNWKRKFKPEVDLSKIKEVSGETKRKLSVSIELKRYQQVKAREIVDHIH